MSTLMLNVVELDDVEGENAIGIECELHALTRTTTHKGGWFGLTGCKSKNIKYIFSGQDKKLRCFYANCGKTSLHMNKTKFPITQTTPINNRSLTR